MRKVAGVQPAERQWTIAEADGQRALRQTAREAIDAVLGPNTGDTVRLLRVVTHTEDQALALLQDPGLPLVEVRIDRHGRPLTRWNARPDVSERAELAEATLDHAREVEAAIDAELRELRRERMAAAGLH